MLVMGLDTALQRCSVAILRDGEAVADETAAMARGHAEHLAPMAARGLAAAGLRVADLDRIGVVVGPGGFTGVRVALAFARGLRLGLETPVVGVASLAALAEGMGAAVGSDAALRGAVIDARRGQVYAGVYANGGREVVAPFISDPEEALKIMETGARMRASARLGAAVRLCGSGAGLLGPLPAGWRIEPGCEEIDAKSVARIAAAAPAPVGPPAPLYLRAPDAKPGRSGLFVRGPEVS